VATLCSAYLLHNWNERHSKACILIRLITQVANATLAVALSPSLLDMATLSLFAASPTIFRKFTHPLVAKHLQETL